MKINKANTGGNKLKIYYSPEALSKIIRLVWAYNKEIGWNMVIKPYEDGYRISDILVYPQKTSFGYVDVDVGKYGLWKASLSDEEDANLFGQGHSHVNFSVTPSPRDEKQQLEEVTNKGSGFYFFQIWNRRLEVNSFFYDIDNNLLYDKNEIQLIIEEDDFIKDSKQKLSDKAKELKEIESV